MLYKKPAENSQRVLFTGSITQEACLENAFPFLKSYFKKDIMAMSSKYVQEMEDMPREKICKRCHSELEIKYNEYESLFLALGVYGLIKKDDKSEDTDK